MLGIVHPTKIPRIMVHGIFLEVMWQLLLGIKNSWNCPPNQNSKNYGPWNFLGSYVAALTWFSSLHDMHAQLNRSPALSLSFVAIS